MPYNAREYKKRRLDGGGRCRVLDLFSGCGGFSLGFHTEGFQIVAALERDATAARTHAYNLFRGHDNLEVHAQARDIIKTTPTKLVRELGLGQPSRAIDVILAGPPCQSYARVGRAKLREIAKKQNAFLHDRRGRLYERMLYYVRVLKPLVIVFENVLDVLNQAGENIVEHICDALGEQGYVCRYTILNAAHYGVPQMRERVFLLAFARELHTTPEFPPPSHEWKLPAGYKASRDVALKPIRKRSAACEVHIISKYFMPSPCSSDQLPSAVTAEQALEDLPIITAEMKAAIKPGARRFNQRLEYNSVLNLSTFAQAVRSWEGFAGRDTVSDHVIRRLPRDYPIFQLMEPGDQYPEAYAIAEEILWPQRLQDIGLDVGDCRPESPNYRLTLLEKQKVVPPYDPTKFVDKWRKMDPNEPARTLTAHLSQDCYTHIHYSSDQARTISVREAARLQSFPDGFRFEGAMNAAFRQIGNAVPPLLARALARHIRTLLSSSDDSGVDKPGGKAEDARSALPQSSTQVSATVQPSTGP